MLLSLLMMTGCIELVDTECTTNQYLAINGSCVQDPGQMDLLQDTGVDVDEEDDEEAGDSTDDGSGDTDGGSDTDDGTDGEATGEDVAGDGGGGDAEPVVESITISCDAGGWYYQVATSIATASATITITETGSTEVDAPTEFHTLTMAGESASGGETYQRDLLLVTDYYFEDVATQFACTDGTNPNLTWQVDLYADTDATEQVGCAAKGHDTSVSAAAGCQVL